MACVGVGTLWGVAAYRILWGDTSIVLTRRFVDSVPGLASLLPVRVVLFGIHLAERAAGHPFHLAENHGWIGLVSGAVGGALGLAAYVLGRAAVRAAWAVGGRRRPGPA